MYYSLSSNITIWDGNGLLSEPPILIYYSTLWDSNYAAIFYEICEHLFGIIYFSIFKQEGPAFSDESRTFIATMGDWYVGEHFSYIKIWGRNYVHMFPKIVTNRLFIEEVSFHTVTDGVYKKLVGPKGKASLNFLWILDH